MSGQHILNCLRLDLRNQQILIDFTIFHYDVHVLAFFLEVLNEIGPVFENEADVDIV